MRIGVIQEERRAEMIWPGFLWDEDIECEVSFRRAARFQKLQHLLNFLFGVPAPIGVTRTRYVNPI